MRCRRTGRSSSMSGGLAVIGGVLSKKNMDKNREIQITYAPFSFSTVTVRKKGNKRLRIVGYFGIGTGIILGINGGKKVSSNWAPKERVEKIVFLYNKKLRKQICILEELFKRLEC